MEKYEQPEIIEIEERIWNDLKFATLENIKSLIDSAEILLILNIKENQDALWDHPYVSAGLYTYAIEEYGKLLILKSYKISEGKVKIMYKREFRNHHKKFEIAIENLPKECLSIGKPLFDPQTFDPNIFDTEATIGDFESRMSIFYSDLEEDKAVKLLPFVDSDTLKKAVDRFKEIIVKIKPYE